jgi:hypothetical protein
MRVDRLDHVNIGLSVKTTVGDRTAQPNGESRRIILFRGAHFWERTRALDAVRRLVAKAARVPVRPGVTQHVPHIEISLKK